MQSLVAQFGRVIGIAQQAGIISQSQRKREDPVIAFPINYRNRVSACREVPGHRPGRNRQRNRGNTEVGVLLRIDQGQNRAGPTGTHRFAAVCAKQTGQRHLQHPVLAVDSDAVRCTGGFEIVTFADGCWNKSDAAAGRQSALLRKAASMESVSIVVGVTLDVSGVQRTAHYSDGIYRRECFQCGGILVFDPIMCLLLS